MRVLVFAGCALALAGCSHGSVDSVPTLPESVDSSAASVARSQSATFKDVYSFKKGGDAANPLTGLINISGTFYGSTYLGGSAGAGSIYSVTPAGTETVLHSFIGSDGAGPTSDLVNINGTLYGVTAGGGLHNGGTVFSISTSGGALTVLHSFGAGSDGSEPG